MAQQNPTASIPSPRLALIGYRGTGKTTVARLVAQRCGCAWYDADDELARRAGMTVREIFESLGEPVFREHEEAVVAELAQRGDGVLALGGGAVLRASNREALERWDVVWLTATPETIARRLASDPVTPQQRPPLTAGGGTAEIERLLVARRNLYQLCADWTVATDARTPEQVADEIVCWLIRRAP